MKKLLIALFLVLSLCIPRSVLAQDRGYYLAVFCEADFMDEWTGEVPNCLYPGKNWDDFKTFIKMVKKESAGRPVVIDIDCHGTTDSLYIEEDPTHGHVANFGYVLNQIDKAHFKHLTVLTEACLAGRVYNKSIHVIGDIHMDGDDFENYHQDKPSYPVYGMNSKNLNWNNFIFLQWKENKRFPEYFRDLREYQDQQLGLADTDPKSLDNQFTLIMYRYLESLDK